jgi:hypothetical protein
VYEDVVGLSPTVLLRIDGDPLGVVRAYQRQFIRVLGGESRTGRATPVRQRVDDGVTVLYVDVVSDDALRLTAYTRSGKPTWGILEADVDV